MKKIFWGATFMFSMLFLAHGAMALGEPISTSSYLPGRVEGTGTSFQVTDAGSMNVTLVSSREVRVTLDSSPTMFSCEISGVSSTVPAQITLGGLEPLKTYYMYTDTYGTPPTVFTTDGGGVYTFTQDLSSTHTIIVQPDKSTYVITDNETGGACTQIGTWDWATKTCTLTADLVLNACGWGFGCPLPGAIALDSGVTLDGANHLITPLVDGLGPGVAIIGGGSTVRNLRISRYNWGIYMAQTGSNLIENCEIYGNFRGGIVAYRVSNSTIRNNVCRDNYSVGIEVGSNGSSYNLVENNTCTRTTGAQATGIILQNIKYWNDAGLNVVRGNVCTYNTVSGLTLAGATGDGAHYNIITNNTLMYNGTETVNVQTQPYVGGLVIGDGANHNQISGNVIQENLRFDLKIFHEYAPNGWNPNNPAESFALSNICSNIATNNMGSGNRPIGFFTSPVSIDNATFSQVIFCAADNSTLNSVVVAGSDTLKNNGILLHRTSGTSLAKVDSSGNRYGLFDTGEYWYYNATRGHHTITASRFDSNKEVGVRLQSNDNIFMGNIASENVSVGIVLNSSQDQLVANVISGNPVGLSLMGSNNIIRSNDITSNAHGLIANCYVGGNQIYNNNFMGNTRHILSNGAANTYNLDRPTGGNFWSGWTGPDADFDGFVDSPYVIPKTAWNYVAGYDYLPFAAPDGWMANLPPVLASIGNKSGSEGQPLEFTLAATDPNGNALTFSAANLPPGATFDPVSATFSWTPDYSQAGNYTDVEFAVADNGSPVEVDVELITITIGNVNRAPVVSAVGPQTIQEYDTLQFAVWAVDPDGDMIVSLGSAGLPSGATFEPATGLFSWRPDGTQAGVYSVSFYASDNGDPSLTGAVDVVITVGEVLSPTNLTDILIGDIVDNPDLPQEAENSYLANLKKVNIFIADGKIGAAINQLEAFIQKTQQDVLLGSISQAQGDVYIMMANDVINLLEGN